MAAEHKFSIGLRLSDLNDYIAPSQACTRPADVPRGAPGAQATQLALAADGSVEEVGADGSRAALGAASVTLNDCLACSGCITSAEGVLVAAQSASESSGAVVVVSLSPHSLASLAAYYDLPLLTTLRKLTTLLRMVGTDYVVDTSFALDMALEETACEFVERLGGSGGPLPLLVSECPGWVCYAEKTQPHALPYMSAVKSGMQVMAAIVRSKHFPRPAGREQAPIFHASIMPCFDKKLEASRDDFARGEGGLREVDTVLATNEVAEVLEKTAPGVRFADLADAPLDDGALPLLNYDAHAGVLFGAPHAAAGGYLEYALRRAVERVHGVRDAGELSFVPASASAAKNADFCEARASAAPAGAPKCACAYGFRNIQNVMRRLKQKTCAYQLVEVVACPQACLNGGGQMKPPEGVSRDKWVERVRARFAERAERSPAANEAAEAMRKLLGREAMRTVFHVREDKSAKNPLAIQW
eukprot:m51a1_g14443 putative cytosolic Fe-S cluster assembling factor Nar1 (472) ;mRNA; f:568660-571125